MPTSQSQKISQLTAATSLQSTDQFVIARSGNNLNITSDVLFKTIPSIIASSVSYDTISTSTTIDVTKPITLITTTNLPLSLTLGAGTANQEKTIVFLSKGTQNATITGSFLGYTSATLIGTGSSIMLKYINNTWVIISTFGVTLV